jgi:hypothetical protein
MTDTLSFHYQFATKVQILHGITHGVRHPDWRWLAVRVRLQYFIYYFCRCEDVTQTIFNETDNESITQDWLKLIIDKYNFPEKYNTKADKPAFQKL